MDINIIYFSQTGNTQKVAKVIANVFSSENHSVRTISYKKVTESDFIEPEVFGVGAPCFESQAPSVVKDYLWSLPDLKKKKAFVFSTSGGAPGKVLYDMAKPLMKKGAEVMAGFLCRGTCYYPVPCLVGRCPDRPNEQDLLKAKEFAQNILTHLSSGKDSTMPESRPDAFKHGLGFYQIVGTFINDPLLRFLMPKPKVDENTCTECKWCEEECPTNSIKLSPKPIVSDTCFRCYRCLTGCPEKAMSVNWGISNFIVWTLYNQTFERWFGDLQKGESVY